MKLSRSLYFALMLAFAFTHVAAPRSARADLTSAEIDQLIKGLGSWNPAGALEGLRANMTTQASALKIVEKFKQNPLLTYDVFHMVQTGNTRSGGCLRKEKNRETGRANAGMVTTGEQES